jgi:hypothetical protein
MRAHPRLLDTYNASEGDKVRPPPAARTVATLTIPSEGARGDADAAPQRMAEGLR